MLPKDMLNRHRAKQQAKKAKKRRVASQRTEDELLLGFMGMGVEEPESVEPAPRPERKKAKKIAKPVQMEVDEDVRKEGDFANFLATMGGE